MNMETKTKIAAAFLKAQSEMSNPKKDSSNPYFKSKYADLNAVREATIPVLNAHGITVIQPMVHIDGRNFIKTVLMHESGETIESFTEIIYAKANDAQAQGSGITYARRYGLQSLVCVGADDDDGNAASKKPDPKTGNQVPFSPSHPRWVAAVGALKNGQTTIEKIKETFPDITEEMIVELKVQAGI